MAAVAGILVSLVMCLMAFSCVAQPTVRINPIEDQTLFEGSQFRRLCIVSGVSADFTIRITWERDGNVLDTFEGNSQLQYLLTSVTPLHQGEYVCRVDLVPVTPGSPVTNLPPVPAGTLTVLGKDRIDAPPNQSIMEGSSGSLQCSYNNMGSTGFEHENGTIFTNFITSATLAHQGVYVCDLFDFASGANIRIPITLFVTAPIMIVEVSPRPVHQNLTSAVPLLMAVDFRGSPSQGLTINWFHDNIPIATDDSRIRNSFNGSNGNGRTELFLSLVTHSNTGLYRVVMSISLEIAGEVLYASPQEVVTFQIDLAVGSSLPVTLLVDQVTARTARVSWTLTNRTIDPVIDELLLRVMFANQSHVELKRLTIGTISVVVDNLLPDHGYLLVLSSRNTDGEASSLPFPFTTDFGFPLISKVEADRFNRTSFGLIVHLAYTGGGSIVAVDVSYRPRDGVWTDTDLIVEYGPVSTDLLGISLMVILNSRSEAVMDLTFRVMATNQFHFPSNIVEVNVTKFTPSTIATTAMGSTAVVVSQETELLPLWLIAVIASVVTVLVMLVGVAFVLAFFIHCKRPNSNKFKVQAQPPTILPTILHTAAENGALPAKSAESFRSYTSLTQPSTSTSTGTSTSSESQSTSIASQRSSSFSQTSSSVSRSIGSNRSSAHASTPSLDGTYKKHKRELSEGSVIKAPITPSTTASNSPSNFSKTHFLNSQDNGLDSITELESRGSDDSYTESERDRVRQQVQNERMYQEEKMYQQQVLYASPCSRNNMINYEYVQSTDIIISPPNESSDYQYLQDGETAIIIGDPNQSTGYEYVHDGGTDSIIGDPNQLSINNQQVPSQMRYMQSDHESVASADGSYSSQLRRPIQHRSPTPYNHDYSLPEESMV